ncbi:MAG: glycosyltransferase family 39 protein [Bacteroidales bacterium]
MEHAASVRTTSRPRHGARPLVVAAIAAGLVLRLAFAFGYWTGRPLTHDEVEYLRLAQNIADGRGFTYGEAARGTSPQFGRAPFYPLFLSAIVRTVGPAFEADGETPRSEAIGAVQLAQSLLGGAAIWLVALIASRAAGPRAGVAAAWLSACYPPLVWVGAYVFSEALFIPLALGAVALLGFVLEDRRFADGARPALVLAAGAVSGVAALTRPLMLFFLAFAAVWLLRRRCVRSLAVLALGAILVVAPWTARNYVATGRFVLVASEGGVTFWTGNNSLARGEGDLAANADMKRAEIALRSQYPGWSAEQLERVYYREAWRFISEHPGGWLLLLARKCFYTFVPAGPSYRLHSDRYFYVSVVSYLLLLAAAVPGFLQLRRRATAPRVLWLVAGASVLASVVFLPQERFRIPVLDPTLIVCAAAWAAALPVARRLVPAQD